MTDEKTMRKKKNLYSKHKIILWVQFTKWNFSLWTCIWLVVCRLIFVSGENFYPKRTLFVFLWKWKNSALLGCVCKFECYAFELKTGTTQLCTTHIPCADFCAQWYHVAMMSAIMMLKVNTQTNNDRYNNNNNNNFGDSILVIKPKNIFWREQKNGYYQIEYKIVTELFFRLCEY